ncbi:SipW-dependent-type signal peptide-containing protein [Nocardioides sp. LHD-245]|uniref:SipW-dependent-type signal peptide-containing protein n=1 Tax=Nocardioides sp. LHD-245 TaxID=3051387 RepID=UPI0027E1814B|nr:SipW-dependent-type signal peptide-containing protein [Nocardioides sp. LHD-245]
MTRRTARHRSSRTGWFGHGRTRALLSAGLLLGTGAVATSAYWTDREVAQGVSVRSGELHIDLEDNEQAKPETITDWPDLNLTGMADGDTRAALMTVSNNSIGDATLSYGVKAAATNPLGAALRATVRQGGSINAGTCVGGSLVGGASVPLNGFDEAVSAHLGPGQSHDLCIQVRLPSPSGVLANATSAVTFTFPARQEQ